MSKNIDDDTAAAARVEAREAFIKAESARLLSGPLNPQDRILIRTGFDAGWQAGIEHERSAASGMEGEKDD